MVIVTVTLGKYKSFVTQENRNVNIIIKIDSYLDIKE